MKGELPPIPIIARDTDFRHVFVGSFLHMDDSVEGGFFLCFRCGYFQIQQWACYLTAGEGGGTRGDMRLGTRFFFWWWGVIAIRCFSLYLEKVEEGAGVLPFLKDVCRCQCGQWPKAAVLCFLMLPGMIQSAFRQCTGHFHSEMQHEKADRIRRIPPIPSNRPPFPAWAQLNAHYHPFSKYFICCDITIDLHVCPLVEIYPGE